MSHKAAELDPVSLAKDHAPLFSFLLAFYLLRRIMAKPESPSNKSESADGSGTPVTSKIQFPKLCTETTPAKSP
jgi:hypothetical protein